MAAIAASPWQTRLGPSSAHRTTAALRDRSLCVIPGRGSPDGCSSWKTSSRRRGGRSRGRKGPFPSASSSSSLAEDARPRPPVTSSPPPPTIPSKSNTSVGTFRAGQKRAEVQVPALLLRLNASEVLKRGQEDREGDGEGGGEGESEGEGEFSHLIDSAVAGGVTMVLLSASSGDVGGAELFSAACALRVALRGRAQLVVEERADIAAAANADGVLLSDQGLPAVVARRMMESAAFAEASVLPLVARRVKSPKEALAATAGEGADLLILASEQNTVWNSKELSEQVTVPIVCEARAPIMETDGGLKGDGLLEGCCGLSLDAREVKEALESSGSEARMYVEEVVSALKRAMGGEEGEAGGRGGSETVGRSVAVPVREAPTRRVLELEAEKLVEEERTLLRNFLRLLQAAVPQMSEISLLEDALARLDDLFLVVIVGEFNSGKSSVVNALLGKRFLKEGVVPTTNEITLLRHNSDRGHEDLTERHPDGHIVRFLPAELLKQINLVDTPGTNVILERQQRLTEEFVPRADLVLFVLSADRPLTESEVSFLRYIREWGKKVVFVLNKTDVLSETAEVEEVLQFVADNIQRLLGVDRVQCFPVSARYALRAKLASQLEESSSVDHNRLMQDPSWQMSGFSELEQFIFSFLGGGSDAGAERLRLKLSTPLGVASALLTATERQLAAEIQLVEENKKSLEVLEEQNISQRNGMELEAVRMHLRVSALVDSACQRAEKVVESTLRIGNVNALTQYLVTTDVSRNTSSLPVSRRFDSEVIRSTVTSLRKLLYEYRAWLTSTTTQQIQSQCEFAATRWPQLGGNCAIDVAELQKPQSGTETSVEVLEGFDTRAAALLLDEELRQAVAATFTSFGAAGVSASVLTAVLPSTVEDLLALALCTAGGYSQVLQLPGRREEVKAKVRKAAEGLKTRLIQSMETEFANSVEAGEAALTLALAPYRKAVRVETERVTELKLRAELLSAQLRALQQQVQNLGC